MKTQGKYRVYNNDEHFGDEAEEFFDTYEEADARLEEIKDELFQLNIKESLESAYEEAAEELCYQIREAMVLEICGDEEE